MNNYMSDCKFRQMMLYFSGSKNTIVAVSALTSASDGRIVTMIQRGLIMVLKEGKNHHTYKVLSIHIEPQLERRLESLGLTEGSLITVLNNEKKGALTARFRGTRFALGKRIADNIEIAEVKTDEQNY